MKLVVELNGTNVNPWHRIGLKQNPFPQIAKAEYAGAVHRVQKLGGDPIPNTAYIRETLVGFSDEFVALCCAKYIPGKTVRFAVNWVGE